jgi:hypothetical protein
VSGTQRLTSVNPATLNAILRTSVKSPFHGQNLILRANEYHERFNAVLERHPDLDDKSLAAAFDKFNLWFDEKDNQIIAAKFISDAVKAMQINEPQILSESHDIFHLSESMLCLLDDKARGIDTDNATIFTTAVITLLHDLGRHTEKMLTTQQIDLASSLHHDELSFNASRKILKKLTNSAEVPEELREFVSTVIGTGLKNIGAINKFYSFAVAYDTDRRQLLGSPTAPRDILYYGGMQGKSLSTREILKAPPGYTHYDTGGWFGQHNTMARGVYRDPGIKETRRLDDVFDQLTIEAATIVMLGCCGREDFLNHAFDTDLGLVEVPKERLTNENGPWWPKKPIPKELLAKAKEEAEEVERYIKNPFGIGGSGFISLMKLYLSDHNTVIAKEHLDNVIKNIRNDFDENDLLAWTRIIYYVNRKGIERHLRREKVLQEEQQKQTFLASVSEPFLDVVVGRTNVISGTYSKIQSSKNMCLWIHNTQD